MSAISDRAGTALLDVAALSVAYATKDGLVPAVRNVSLSLERGTVLGIVGESGSGKSTLAQTIMGYRAPGTVLQAGRVVFDGMSLLDAGGPALRTIWGRRVAIVHQNPLATLTPTMRIGDQLLEVLHRRRRYARGTSRQRLVAALNSVHLVNAEGLARRYPHELSGGERQRVSIAIALALEPDLLILDEPTTNLDATTEAGILDLLEEIKARVSAAMVYISHNLGVIARIADHVAVMYAGEIVESGPTTAIFRAPRHPYTAALLACIPRPGATKRQARLPAIPAGAATRPGEKGCVFRFRCGNRSPLCEETPLWTDADGHGARCWHPDAAAAAGDGGGPATTVRPAAEPVLSANHLSKSYGRTRHGRAGAARAVTRASLQVPRGAIVGLVGESGSGKSTLLRCIAGLETPEEGRVTFLGIDLPAGLAARKREALRALQMVFQDPESTLNPALTVGDNLRRHLKALRPVGTATARREVDRALDQVRLGPRFRDRLPGALSGGEKQRVAIARAFLSEPQLVLCDEPLSALDVSVQATICQLLLDLQGRDGNSYVFVSHDLSIVRYMSDTIVVMYFGTVVEEGEADSFDRLPLHPYSEALFSATPVPDPRAVPARIRLSGHVTAADKERPGCIFSGRCPRRIGAVCDTQPPAWQTVGDRRYLCHWHPDDLQALQAASQENQRWSR